VGLVVGLICGLDLCCKRWLGLIYVICFLFVCIVRSRIGKAVEERNCRRKKAGEEGRREKKSDEEEREKIILKNLENEGILGVVKKINK
jgi:hypothetical protein